MNKVINFTLIRDYVSSHSETSEDSLTTTGKSFIKLCNAAIICYRFTGTLGNLSAAFEHLVALIEKEKSEDKIRKSK
ncbi:MAG: hypothetical protein ACM3UR_08510 [Bacteroidota bacterium]|jgi:hypothetical protein|nr:hypothetical protein [Ignavibacteria bacterium]HEX2963101.1 hypothetical protein [Ignavibacteriales bacterium]MCU7498416.1 hypothetical protein [Ignavibacteria bacterium]MCU7511958.1 hypothetical protein [Ignavibacteria bacterium]MCU7520009.1 hypothetical protein [Ignavibacteria bacterium]